MIRLNKVMIEGRIVDAERYLECKVYIAEPMEKFTSAAKPFELVRHPKLKPNKINNKIQWEAVVDVVCDKKQQ